MKSKRTGIYLTMMAYALLNGFMNGSSHNKIEYDAISVKGLSAKEMGTTGSKKKPRSKRRRY